jgi:hypothetical protein
VHRAHMSAPGPNGIRVFDPSLVSGRALGSQYLSEYWSPMNHSYNRFLEGNTLNISHMAGTIIERNGYDFLELVREHVVEAI